MSMNVVIIEGNVASDLQVKNFEDGGKIVSFRIATNERGYKLKNGKDVPEKTDFHNVVVNGKGLAGIVEKYVKKGNKLLLRGKLRNRSYEKDGITHYTTEIIAEDIDLINGRPQADAASQPSSQPSAQPSEQKEGDLPF